MSASTLRPTGWGEYLGQEKLKRDLQIRIRSAVRREAMLDHILFVAPPGYGKTSLAKLVADEIGDQFWVFDMPIPEAQLAYYLKQADQTILFLDELHKLRPRAQEFLLAPMAENMISDRGRKVPLTGPFTIIGATTEPGALIPTLYERFKIQPVFEDYTDEEMGQICIQMAAKMGVNLPPELALEYGRAAAGAPRQAETLMMGARDIGDPMAISEVLSLCGLTPDGLSHHQVEYLKFLESTRDGTAGEATIANALRVGRDYVGELERPLVKRGLVEYTSRGRSLTAEGYRRTSERGEGDGLNTSGRSQDSSRRIRNSG
jgi:Holliday junction DNA helicase RuvB